MKKQGKTEKEDEFFSNPQIMKHFPLLQEIGIFSHFDSLQDEMNNYKTLFAGALDIVNKPTISEIMDATVWQI